MLKFLKEMRRTYIILGIVMVFLFVVSSLLSYYTPYSGRAFIEYNLTPISSALSGKVEKVYVRDNTHIKRGDIIFKIEDIKYRENVNDLEAQYKQAINDISVLNSKIIQSRRKLIKNISVLKKKKLDYTRFKQLYQEKLIAKSEFETYELSYKNAKEEVEISKEYIRGLEHERGSSSQDENNILLELKSRIIKAKKDLKDTTIKASIGGIVSLHQFTVGELVATNSTYGYIYDKNDFNIYVDYMEKSLVNMKDNQNTLILFDAVPGRLFKGHIERTTSLLSSGYTSSKNLHNVDENTRWIRPSGRVRVKVVLDEKIPNWINISSGSKAAVVTLNDNHKVLSAISIFWLKISSYINYIY